MNPVTTDGENKEGALAFLEAQASAVGCTKVAPEIRRAFLEGTINIFLFPSVPLGTSRRCAPGVCWSDDSSFLVDGSSVVRVPVKANTRFFAVFVFVFFRCRGKRC